MPDLTRLVAWLRGRRSDQKKAWTYLEAQADAAFRELAGDYDQFVEHVQHVKEPSILLGTARDASGAAVPVRYALNELFGFDAYRSGGDTGP